MYLAPQLDSDLLYVIDSTRPLPSIIRPQAWSSRKHQGEQRGRGHRLSSISLPTEVCFISYCEGCFQELIDYVAKTLKKTWVDTKKLKSKWKAEKRKGGLATGSNMIEQGGRKAEEDGDEAEAEASNHLSEAGSEIDEEPATTTSQQPSSRSYRTDAARTSQGKDDDHDEKSLRDLTKEAYSRSSLHTYKSDPLNRSRGRGRGPQRGRGDSGRGALRGGRGRGQPNMKLRMGAMLEKIKRDYS